MNVSFRRGLMNGIPIALGYLSVSFGFGIMAVRVGLSPLTAVGISLTNLTSAGQVAGVEVMAAGGTLLEMILTELVINIRYALMGFSLSQKTDSSFTTPRRLLVSFGITDEIYAVAISQAEAVSFLYMLGLILLPLVGWTLGTALGALAGALLPTSISNAMGLVLYGMFFAIFVPPAKRARPILWVVLLAAAIRTALWFLLPDFPGGFAVIISGVVASVVVALFCPTPEEKEANPS